MRNRLSRLLLAALAAGALLMTTSGCVAPRVMVSNTIQSERTVQYILQQSAGSDDEGEALYNLYVRVCPLSDAGEVVAQCQLSMVLENVVFEALGQTYAQ